MIAVVFSIGCLIAAWLVDRRRLVYADLGTTPAAAVSAGRNEVKGRAWHQEPLQSFHSETPCVKWSYSLEEEREHTLTVTSTDGKGRTSTHTETYRQWHTIDSRADSREHFELVDSSGAVRVLLRGASTSTRVFVSETFNEGDDRGFLEKMFSGGGRTGRYRRSENGLAIGDELYVVGEASLRDDVGEPQIDHGSPFVISTRSESSHRGGLAAITTIFVVLATVTAALAGAASWGPAGVLVGIGSVLVLVAASSLVVLHNRLQLVVGQAARAWSLIDIQLTRHHQLIPQLAQIARAGTDHERVVLESISVVRSRLVDGAPDATTIAQADFEAAEQTTRLRDLLAIVAAYPELASGEAMQKLQRELADTETRIAGAREFYNNAVTIVRNRRSTFPGVLVARFADPRRFALFATEGFERTVPRIEYNF